MDTTDDTAQDSERVLRHFLDADGRLHTIPTKRTKRLVVLDHLAQSFEPGQLYAEVAVNDALARFHPDYAALRRYLVEEEFLTREEGELLALGRDVPRLMGDGSDTEVRDEDWYGDDLGDAAYDGVRFLDVDLTESRSHGARFEGCVFERCRFNASVHVGSAFVGCTFAQVNFFDATLDGCKLTGSVFTRCTLRPMRVRGGQWRGVVLRGADLSGLDLSGLDLREADLSMTRLTDTRLVAARLTGAEMREADLTRADLRGAALDGVDLHAATLAATRLDLAGAVRLAELHGADVDTAATESS